MELLATCSVALENGPTNRLQAKEYVQKMFSNFDWAGCFKRGCVNSVLLVSALVAIAWWQEEVWESFVLLDMGVKELTLFPFAAYCAGLFLSYK